MKSINGSGSKLNELKPITAKNPKANQGTATLDDRFGSWASIPTRLLIFAIALTSNNL